MESGEAYDFAVIDQEFTNSASPNPKNGKKSDKGSYLQDSEEYKKMLEDKENLLYKQLIRLENGINCDLTNKQGWKADSTQSS